MHRPAARKTRLLIPAWVVSRSNGQRQATKHTRRRRFPSTKRVVEPPTLRRGPDVLRLNQTRSRSSPNRSWPLSTATPTADQRRGPRANFMPNHGRMAEWVLPLGTGIGVDAYVQPDATSHRSTTRWWPRSSCTRRTDRRRSRSCGVRSSGCVYGGVTTTAPLHQAILAQESFASRPIIIRWLEESFLPLWESAS